MEGEEQPKRDTDPVETGGVNQRYVRFRRVLGRGSFKTVYAAFDTVDCLEVAWNKLHVDRLNAEERKKIINEVRLLGAIHHKNIIRLYDSFTCSDPDADGVTSIAFITEQMMSGTLKEYLMKAREVKIKVIRKWCSNILDAIAYLHEQRIMHRDIKLDNLFINGHVGEVKIGDLGLSAVRDADKAGSVIGTPAFMSPEIYEETYTEKVDIYAFGMCLLEMITMELPYQECKGPAQIMKKVFNNEKPASFKRLVDCDVKEVIAACLEREPRRPSAAELRQHPLFIEWESDDGTRSNLSLMHEQPLEQDGQEGDGLSTLLYSEPLDRDVLVVTQEANGGNEAGSDPTVRVEATNVGPSLHLELKWPIQGVLKSVSFAFNPGDKPEQLAADMVKEFALDSSQVNDLTDEIQLQVNRCIARRERQQEDLARSPQVFGLQQSGSGVDSVASAQGQNGRATDVQGSSGAEVSASYAAPMEGHASVSSAPHLEEHVGVVPSLDHMRTPEREQRVQMPSIAAPVARDVLPISLPVDASIPPRSSSVPPHPSSPSVDLQGVPRDAESERPPGLVHARSLSPTLDVTSSNEELLEGQLDDRRLSHHVEQCVSQHVEQRGSQHAELHHEQSHLFDSHDVEVPAVNPHHTGDDLESRRVEADHVEEERIEQSRTDSCAVNAHVEVSRGDVQHRDVQHVESQQVQMVHGEGQHPNLHSQEETSLDPQPLSHHMGRQHVETPRIEDSDDGAMEIGVESHPPLQQVSGAGEAGARQELENEIHGHGGEPFETLQQHVPTSDPVEHSGVSHILREPNISNLSSPGEEQSAMAAESQGILAQSRGSVENGFAAIQEHTEMLPEGVSSSFSAAAVPLDAPGGEAQQAAFHVGLSGEPAVGQSFTEPQMDAFPGGSSLHEYVHQSTSRTSAATHAPVVSVPSVNSPQPKRPASIVVVGADKKSSVAHVRDSSRPAGIKDSVVDRTYPVGGDGPGDVRSPMSQPPITPISAQSGVNVLPPPMSGGLPASHHQPATTQHQHQGKAQLPLQQHHPDRPHHSAGLATAPTGRPPSSSPSTLSVRTASFRSVQSDESSAAPASVNAVSPAQAGASVTSLPGNADLSSTGPSSNDGGKNPSGSMSLESETDQKWYTLCLELMYNANRGRPGPVKQKLAQGASVTFADYDKRTPLHLAAASGSLETVNVLLENGAEVNARDRWGGTPLRDAMQSNHRIILERLRAAGADESADEATNDKPSIELLQFSAQGNLEAVKERVRSGVPVTTCDYESRTALHLACNSGHADVIDFLLLNGADPHAKDRMGRTPIDNAVNNGHRNVLGILRGQGSDSSLHALRENRGAMPPLPHAQAPSSAQATFSGGWAQSDGSPVNGNGSGPFTSNRPRSSPNPEQLETLRTTMAITHSLSMGHIGIEADEFAASKAVCASGQGRGPTDGLQGSSQSLPPTPFEAVDESMDEEHARILEEYERQRRLLDAEHRAKIEGLRRKKTAGSRTSLDQGGGSWTATPQSGTPMLASGTTSPAVPPGSSSPEDSKPLGGRSGPPPTMQLSESSVVHGLHSLGLHGSRPSSPAPGAIAAGGGVWDRLHGGAIEVQVPMVDPSGRTRGDERREEASRPFEGHDEHVEQRDLVEEDARSGDPGTASAHGGARSHDALAPVGSTINGMVDGMVDNVFESSSKSA